MKLQLVLFVYFCQFISSNYGSNILGIFPHPGYSHFKVFYPILNELARKGHRITVLTSVQAPETHHKNYEEILIEKNGEIINIVEIERINSSTSARTMSKAEVNMLEIGRKNPSRSLLAMYNEFWMLADEGQRACENLYNETLTKQIFNKHTASPFDLVILEMFNTDCHLGIVQKLSIPSIVGLSSCVMMPWHYDRVALPDYPSYIPSEFVEFDFEMSFTQRIINYIVTKGLKIMYRLFVELEDNRIIKEKLNIDVDVGEIAKRVNLFMVNQHYSLNGPRPLSTKVIEIGGIHVGKKPTSTELQQSLPKNLLKFLDAAEHGVIVFSWGSLIKSSTLPRNTVARIIRALEKLPQKIIWKWENDDIPTKSEKFFFSKWISQRNILCHPKVRLFWAHGGLLGVTEATHCGVPLLMTPFYGDQFVNSKLIETRKTGKILPYEEITEVNVQKTINEILQPSYAENAKFVSKIFNNRQNTPLDTATWHIENILQNPNNNLSFSPAVNLNWFTYNSYDVILVLLIVILSVLITVLLLLVKFFNCCCRQNKSQCFSNNKTKQKES